MLRWHMARCVFWVVSVFVLTKIVSEDGVACKKPWQRTNILKVSMDHPNHRVALA